MKADSGSEGEPYPLKPYRVWARRVVPVMLTLGRVRREDGNESESKPGFIVEFQASPSRVRPCCHCLFLKPTEDLQMTTVSALQSWNLELPASVSRSSKGSEGNQSINNAVSAFLPRVGREGIKDSV